MTIVYDKLWQRLNDMHMQKQELREAAGISRASMAKLAKNENVTTDVLAKVCAALDCDIADIAEFRRDTLKRLQPGLQPSFPRWSGGFSFREMRSRSMKRR